MSSHPTIVGLTLSYRDTLHTPRCIESLLKEGADHVLVWDNSADGGLTAAALEQRFANDARVSIETSQTNLGFSAGVNRGIERISAHFERPWILLINNDAHLLPGAIQALAAALSRDPQAVLAYPDIDHAGLVLGTMYYQRHTGLLSRRTLPGSFAYASGCCQLIAIERNRSTSLFDKDFFMYGEDWQQGLTLGNYRMAHVAQTLAYHKGSSSSGMGSNFYESRIVNAHWLLAHKMAHTRAELGLLLGLRLITLSLRALVRTLRYRSSIPLRAFMQGIRPGPDGPK